MARFFDGTDDVLVVNEGLAAFQFGPGTFACIVNILTTGARPLFSIQSDAAAEHLEFYFGSAGDPRVYMNSANKTTTSALRITSTTGWVVYAWTKTTAASSAPRAMRYKYSDDTAVFEDVAATVSGAAWTGSPHIGDDPIGTTSLFLHADLALMGLWDVAMTDEQLKALAYNLSAWYAAGKPRALWVFDQAAPAQKVLDLSGGGANESSLVGTAVSTSSVPVFSYGHGVDVIGVIAGGELVEMAASAAGTSTVTTDATGVRVTRRLAAAPAGVASVTTLTEAPRITLRLAATATGVGATTATLNLIRLMAATAAGSSTTTSALSVVKRLAGVVTGVGAVTAFARMTVRLAGVVAGAGVVTPTVQAPRLTLRLAAAPAGAATVTASLGSLRLLAATAAGSSSVTAGLGVTRRLAASVTGTSTVTAPLTKLIPLAGTVAGTSTVTGAMTMTRGLRAAPAGTSTVTGALRVFKALVATVTGTSTVTAFIRVRIRIAATVTGVATVEACLRLVLPDFIDDAAPGSLTLTGAAPGATTLAGATPGALTLEPRTPYNEC